MAVRGGSSTGPCLRGSSRDLATGATRYTNTCPEPADALPQALGVVLLVAVIALPLIVAAVLIYRAHKRVRRQNTLLAVA